MFGKIKRVNQMEALGKMLSGVFGRMSPELHDANPAPIAVLASDSKHQTFITIKDDHYVLYMDENNSGSIPQSQVLAPVGSDLTQIPLRIVDTLEWVAKKSVSEGRYELGIAFYGDIIRLVSGNDKFTKVQAAMSVKQCEIWWDHFPPKHPQELTGLFNSLIKLGQPTWYAAMRYLGGQAYERLMESGDTRFTPDTADLSYKMGLDAIKGNSTESTEHIRTLLKNARKSLKKRFPEE